MMSIGFVAAMEDMKFSRGMRRARSARYKQTRKDRKAVSKDNTIGKKLMERDSQRHMTQEKHHNITIQTKGKNGDKSLATPKQGVSIPPIGLPICLPPPIALPIMPVISHVPTPCPLPPPSCFMPPPLWTTQ